VVYHSARPTSCQFTMTYSVDGWRDLSHGGKFGTQWLRCPRSDGSLSRLVEMGNLKFYGNMFRHRHDRALCLERFEKSGEPYSGSLDPKTAGNGSLMRLGPVALFY